MSRKSRRFVDLAEACLLLLVIETALATGGMGRGVAVARRLVTLGRARSKPAAPKDREAELLAAVTRAGALFPTKTRCLELSLALAVACRWSALPARLRVGATTTPFTAHAWVEIDGRALNPVDAQFACLPTFDIDL